MSPRPILFVSVLLLAGAFAGCVDDEAAPEVPDPAATLPGEVVSADGRDLREALTAEDSVDVPVWRVGEIFGHHFFFGADDITGSHLNGIVVEETADAYVMAPDDPVVAREHAVWQYPIFGEIRKDDLSSKAFGGLDWDLYDFPLTDGKTWQRSFAIPDFTGGGDDLAWELTFTARFAPAIETLAGPKPGFEIEAITQNDTLLLEFDYVPFYGWYSKFLMFDLQAEDPGTQMFRVMRMGHEYDYSGKYYVATAEQVIEKMSMIGTDESGRLVTEPSPYNTFTVGAEADTLYGFVISFAFAGAHDVILMDPDNQYRHYDAVPAGPTEFAFRFEFIDEEAVPGEWRVLMAGAGAASGGFLMLWQITTEVFEMLSEGSAPIS